ncbi:MAG: adenylate kinase [Bacilli bacterium]
MNIILVGPPGSGKGTQAFSIKDKYQLDHISTGDLFRDAIKNQTELGKQVSSILEKGELVSDELTLSIVEEAISKVTKKGYLLDGYPRTVRQAELLDELNTEIDAVIYFKIDTELLIERLTGRRICKSCGASYHIIFNAPIKEGVCNECGGELYQRNDDNVESAQTRLNEFFDKTLPLIDYYKNQGKLFEVDASLEMSMVTSNIDAIFEEVK